MRAARRGLAMGHFKLTLGTFIDAFAIPQQFADAKNGGERIIQFVGDACKHLAHSGKFFCLDQLFFKALDFGDVAAGDDHAFDFSRFIEQGAEVTFQSAPFAILVANLSFDGAKILSAGQKILQHPQDGAAFVGVGALTKGRADEFVDFVAQNGRHLGTDIGVAFVYVDDKNQIGETVDQAASELLFLVKALFDLTLFRDIDEGALIARDFATGIANGGRSMETDDGAAILAEKRNLTAFGSWLVLDFADHIGALHFIDEDFGNTFGKQLFPGVVAQNSNERWIDFPDAVIWGGYVDAFLKSFKQFREARSFCLAEVISLPNTVMP